MTADQADKECAEGSERARRASGRWSAGRQRFGMSEKARALGDRGKRQSKRDK